MAGTGTRYTLPLPVFEKPVKVLIVVAPYYKDIADDLVAGARAVLDETGAAHETIEVPGALEVPSAIALAHRMSNFDGYVALGCIVRGETTHYDTVCKDSSRGLALLGLQGAAIGNGILTVGNRDQAAVRADPKDRNKGGVAAVAALHLVALARKWSGETKGLGFRPSDDSYRIAGTGAGGPETA